MWYKPKENEFLRYEYIDQHHELWQYECSVATVPTSLVPSLRLFKRYTETYPGMDENIMQYPSLRLFDGYGRLIYVPFKLYVMRNFNHAKLIEDLKAGIWDFTVIDD